MNVLTMPLHSGPEALPQATTLPLVGFTTTLMQLRVVLAVTTSLRSWNGCSAFERMLCLFPIVGFCLVFTIGFIMLVVHLT